MCFTPKIPYAAKSTSNNVIHVFINSKNILTPFPIKATSFKSEFKFICLYYINRYFSIDFKIAATAYF